MRPEKALSLVSRSLFLLFLASLLWGCAGDRASRREVERLSEEVRRLRLEAAGHESRIAALERQIDRLARREEGRNGTESATAFQLPEDLTVVRIEPRSMPAYAEPEEEDSYAFIAVGSDEPPAPRSLGADAAPPLPTSTPIRDPLSARDLERAKELLAAGRLEEGIRELQAFVAQNPRDPHADDALLALGEAWLLRGLPNRALEAFERVVTEYPGGDAVPMALLRYGDTSLSLGKRAAARAAYQRLIEAFPGSRPAALARSKLSLLHGDSP